MALIPRFHSLYAPGSVRRLPSQTGSRTFGTVLLLLSWRMSGPKAKVVAGSGSSSKPSLGRERARGSPLSSILVDRRSSVVDAVAIVHVVVVRRLVHVVRVVVV